ncbi:hypothetical protein [Xylanivirga thermophila]|uniref:hypothetical protein n=1 Tax=Xylanivirga thermophila TaxID=2496273 RepID=UPI00101C60A7|nr:hypothetical protein [Xylanivirga thermophila]
MKKVISLLLVLLLVLTMVTGCGQSEKKLETSGEKTIETTPDVKTNKTDSKTAKDNSGDTELFGVPMKTEDYFIQDLSDPNNQYTLKCMTEKIFGMDGYIISGEEVKEGEYKEGTSFLVYAKDGKALTIEDITYLDETYLISLKEVEKGTPQSHEKLSIVTKKPFKDQTIKYEDGTMVRNINLLAEEVGIERIEGEFQRVEGDKIEIISMYSTLAKVYAMDGVTPESLEGLQKDDTIEYMRGLRNDTVYAIRKIEE